MRDAAWAALFEAMFKFRLAYTDEPIPIRREDPDDPDCIQNLFCIKSLVILTF